MQVTVEDIGTLGRKLTVSLEEDQISDKVDQKLKELGGQVRIKGFRPGKVPGSVVQQRYGKQVRGEVLAEMMQSSLGEALEQEKLQPVAMPKLEDQNDKDGLTYTMSFEVFPELGELDISNVKLEKIESEVLDSDIDDMLKTLQQQRKTWNDVERAAQNDDLVVFEMQFKNEDLTYPENEPERMGGVLGNSGLIESMEKALTGRKLDDEVSEEMTFPEDYRVQDLAGLTGMVAMKIIRVAEGELPEIDAEFMKGFGVETGDEATFREEIKKNLTRELDGTIRGKLKKSVVTALINEFSDFELPASLVNEELDVLKKSAESEQSNEPVTEEKAQERVRAALILRQLAEQSKLEADPQKVSELIESVASTYERPEEVVRYYLSNEQLMAQVQQQALEDQVAEWVSENAATTPNKMTFGEVMKPA